MIRVGDGIEPIVIDENTTDSILISPSMLKHSNIEELVDKVYPDLINNFNDPEYIINRAILTTKNSEVDKINDRIIDKFPRTSMRYLSADSVVECDNESKMCNRQRSISLCHFKTYSRWIQLTSRKRKNQTTHSDRNRINM